MQSVIAYLDPGSGSIVLQAILGGLGGIALLWARMRHRIRGKLGRGSAAEPQSGTAESSETAPGADAGTSAEPERAEEHTSSP